MAGTKEVTSGEFLPPPQLVHKTSGQLLEQSSKCAGWERGSGRGGGEQSTAIISEPKSGSGRHPSLVTEAIPGPRWGSGDGLQMLLAAHGW